MISVSKNTETTYERIRSSAFKEVSTVSKNTGVSETEIRAIKQHIFFDEHRIYNEDQGRIIRQRFDAMDETAFVWQKAMERP